MRGHFNCDAFPHPRETIAPGTVIALEMLTTTLFNTGFTLRDRYPNLKALGTPIRLDRRHRRIETGDR